MNYKDFDYQDYEWDNVPKIVVKFLIHLEKYTKGVSKKMYEFHCREHVDDLRNDIEYQIGETNKNMQDQRFTDIAEKNILRNKSDSIKDR